MWAVRWSRKNEEGMRKCEEEWGSMRRNEEEAAEREQVRGGEREA